MLTFPVSPFGLDFIVLAKKTVFLIRVMKSGKNNANIYWGGEGAIIELPGARQ